MLEIEWITESESAKLQQFMFFFPQGSAQTVGSQEIAEWASETRRQCLVPILGKFGYSYHIY